MKIFSKYLMQVISVAGLAAVPIVASVSSAVAAQVEGPKVEWNFAMWGKSRALSLSVEELARRVSEATDGNFTIKIHWGGALAPPKEQIDGLKIGAYESTMVVVDYAPGKTPGLTGPSLPFLPVPDEHTSIKVRDAYYQHPSLKRDYQAWKVMYSMAVLVPSYEYMGVGAAPKGVADYQGKRVRAIGGLGDAMRKIGAIPTSFVSSEVYSALERGVLDAVAFGYYAHQAYGLHNISKWYTKGMDMGRPSGFIGYNTDAWKVLPKPYQDLINSVAPLSVKAQADAYQKIENEAEAEFLKVGLELVEVSEEERAEFVKVGAAPVWSEWVKDVTEKGYPGQELLDLMLSTAKQARM